jgi:hypothetical protein
MAKDPTVKPHYMTVLIIRPKKTVLAQSLSLFPLMYLTPSLMSQYLSMSPISYLALRKLLVLLCAPNGVPEHLKPVHLQFLDLT